MSITVNDLQKTVGQGLTTALITSRINFGQLLIEINVEDLYSTILYLKTNDKCRFKQLIDITAVDYPEKYNRFKIVYLFLSHENNLRIKVSINLSTPCAAGCCGPKFKFIVLVCLAITNP